MRINYDKVIRQAHEMDELGCELQRIAVELNEMQQGMQAAWKGDAATAYTQKCLGLKETIEKTAKNIVSVSRVIKNTADNIRDEDEKLARRLDKRLATRDLINK